MRRKFSASFLLLTVVVGASLAGCGSSAAPTTTTTAASGGSTTTGPTGSTTTATTSLPTATVRISLDFYANVDYLGIYAAIQNGYFKQEGINPVIIPYTGTSAETLIQTGKADIGLTYPPNIPANRASGLKYRAIAGVTQVNTIALAVLASSRFTNVAQLSGQLYGGFGAPSDPPIITAIFRHAGVANPVFRQVTLTTGAYQALAAGRVAYTTVFGGIDDVTAELQGVHLRLFPDKNYLGSTFSFPDDAFVASDQEISQKADILRRTLKALSEGYVFAAHNPAKAEQILIALNKTALAHSENIVDATGNATAKDFLSSAGSWGCLKATDFAGIGALLHTAGLIKGTLPPATDSFTNSLLPSCP